jgi:hypothetical protein
MGPKQSRISRKDVRLGLRYAWHEEPDKAIINGYMILALGALTLFSPDAVFLALTLTFLAPFVFSLGYQVYRGLAAARDGRDFGDYLDTVNQTWPMPADFDDGEDDWIVDVIHSQREERDRQILGEDDPE